jgi:hypothetical protein
MSIVCENIALHLNLGFFLFADPSKLLDSDEEELDE